MKDESGRPQNETDVLKFFIWLMLVMTLVLAGFSWKEWSDLEATKKNLEFGQRLMTDPKPDVNIAQQQAQIEGMLAVHKTNKEDVARDQPLTWFSTMWRNCGIDNGSMQPGAWKVPPDYNARGKFAEERIDMVFNPRAPLTREQIARFCHQIEKSSTRLRIIELDVRRTDKENFEKDEWGGKATIGYRHTPENRN